MASWKILNLGLSWEKKAIELGIFQPGASTPAADPQFLVETANVKFQGDNIVMEWIGHGHVKDFFH